MKESDASWLQPAKKVFMTLVSLLFAWELARKPERKNAGSKRVNTSGDRWKDMRMISFIVHIYPFLYRLDKVRVESM